MYWDTMDILGYDVMAIAYQIYNIYIYAYICTVLILAENLWVYGDIVNSSSGYKK